MHTVKLRYIEPGLKPRRTKLEIPGWAGDREPRADGSMEQPWHCMLFSEGAQYGIEIFYPYEHELRVTTREGKLVFDGDFGPQLDINPGEGWAIRTEPHPRFYTDPTDTVPIAVPALVRNWWPMLYFMVFKSPAEGRSHIFRPGEPMAQIMIIPEESDFELAEMSDEEQADRELRSRRIYEARSTLAADTHWKSRSNTAFDGIYRHILRAAKAKP